MSFVSNEVLLAINKARLLQQQKNYNNKIKPFPAKQKNSYPCYMTNDTHFLHDIINRFPLNSLGILIGYSSAQSPLLIGSLTLDTNSRASG